MRAAETLELPAVAWKERTLFVAWCPDVDVASQGRTIDGALSNLREALELYFSDEDVEKPAEAKTPVVTLIRVRAR